MDIKQKTPGILMDELWTACQKNKVKPSDFLDRRIEMLNNALIEILTLQQVEASQDLWRHLCSTNQALWNAQEILCSSKDDGEVAYYAREAQFLNKKRNQWIEQLDELFEYGEYTVTEKTY